MCQSYKEHETSINAPKQDNSRVICSNRKEKIWFRRNHRKAHITKETGNEIKVKTYCIQNFLKHTTLCNKQLVFTALERCILFCCINPYIVVSVISIWFHYPFNNMNYVVRLYCITTHVCLSLVPVNIYLVEYNVVYV